MPTLEQEAKRSVSRLRDSIVDLRRKVACKIKSLLFTQGLISGEEDAVTSKRWLEKKVKEVEALNYPMGFFYTLKRYADQWLVFTNDLVQIKKELLSMQTKEELALLRIYKSAPGIGDITALKLKDELGDMKQFSNICRSCLDCHSKRSSASGNIPTIIKNTRR